MKDTISKLKAQRHEMNNIIILSVILGILINMISGIISNIFEIESWINLIVLLFFCTCRIQKFFRGSGGSLYVAVLPLQTNQKPGR